MGVEHILVERYWLLKTEVLVGTLAQCQLVHFKTHMGLNPCLPSEGKVTDWAVARSAFREVQTRSCRWWWRTVAFPVVYLSFNKQYLICCLSLSPASSSCSSWNRKAKQREWFAAFQPAPDWVPDVLSGRGEVARFYLTSTPEVSLELGVIWGLL